MNKSYNPKRKLSHNLLLRQKSIITLPNLQKSPEDYLSKNPFRLNSPKGYFFGLKRSHSPRVLLKKNLTSSIDISKQGDPSNDRLAKQAIRDLRKNLKELFRLTKAKWVFKERIKEALSDKFYNKDDLIDLFMGDKHIPFPMSISTERLVAYITDKTGELILERMRCFIFVNKLISMKVDEVEKYNQEFSVNSARSHLDHIKELYLQRDSTKNDTFFSNRTRKISMNKQEKEEITGICIRKAHKNCVIDWIKRRENHGTLDFGISSRRKHHNKIARNIIKGIFNTIEEYGR